MTTRMVHPQHGATHAYDTGEIDRLKGLGWEVECSAPKLPTLNPDPLPESPYPQAVEPEKRKAGRPAKAK